MVYDVACNPVLDLMELWPPYGYVKVDGSTSKFEVLPIAVAQGSITCTESDDGTGQQRMKLHYSEKAVPDDAKAFDIRKKALVGGHS